MLEFTRRDVSRGFTLPNTQTYAARFVGSGLQDPFLSSCVRSPVTQYLAEFLCRTHAPPYPLHNSFPHIFTIDRSHTRTIPLFTSLSTTPRTSSLFSTFARFVEANLDIGDVEGLGKDEMKELGNDLWGICDGFGDGDEGRVDWDELGEDEE